jgi:polysaccharide export outer membrane protein
LAEGFFVGYISSMLNFSKSRLFLLSCALYLSLGVAWVQAAPLSLSPDEIKALQGLTEAEKAALANQVGVDPAQVKGASIGEPVLPPAAPIARPTVSTNGAAVAPVNDSANQVNKSAESQSSRQARVDLEKQINPLSHAFEDLKPFGYDLFASSPSTFAPVDRVPVPNDYVVGPGDRVSIQFYGKENSTKEIEINREGVLQLPNIGPLPVVGMTFDAMSRRVRDLVKEQMIGVDVNVSLGALRSIQVFILGESYKPGAYTVSALSTLTNALFVSGGITELGSLRKIELKRQDKVVAVLDLYDLLLKGDTTADQRLRAGDVIFIPPAQKRVGVSGAVLRPAVYEIKNEANLAELVQLAGGFLPTAFPSVSRLDRINNKGQRTIVDVDLAAKSGKSYSLRSGDRLQVYSVLDRIESSVAVTGHVQRPSGFAWRPGLRVTDVIKHVADLLPNPNLEVALIERESGPSRQVTVQHFSLAKALAQPKSSNDPKLESRDRIIVLAQSLDSQDSLKDLNDRLAQSVAVGAYPQIVQVYGWTRFPGTFPWSSGLTVKDILALSGGLRPEVNLQGAFLAIQNSQSGLIQVEKIALSNSSDLNRKVPRYASLYVLPINESAQAILSPLNDKLEKQASEGHPAQTVRISGSVRFPGRFPLTRDMSLDDLLLVAGGMAEEAYGLEAELTREILDGQGVSSTMHQILSLEQDSEDVGRGFILQSRDSVTVKSISGWGQRLTVTLQGLVKFPGTYPIRKGETLSSVIQRAGGLLPDANADGAIFLRESLREREQVELDRYRQRLQQDLAVMQLKKTGINKEGDESSQNNAAQLQSLIAQSTEVKAKGRMVINLTSLLAGEKTSDVILRDQDNLVIPPLAQEVSVLGEVQFPTSHLYRVGWDTADYVKHSGQGSRLADLNRAYVIRANGNVVPAYRDLFLFRMGAGVKPGDTIVVPVNTQIGQGLKNTVTISQILFNLATTAAALQSVGVYQ